MLNDTVWLNITEVRSYKTDLTTLCPAGDQASLSAVSRYVLVVGTGAWSSSNHCHGNDTQQHSDYRLQLSSHSVGFSPSRIHVRVRLSGTDFGRWTLPPSMTEHVSENAQQRWKQTNSLWFTQHESGIAVDCTSRGRIWELSKNRRV